MAEHYPETEGNVPLEQRQGHIPHGSLAAVNAYCFCKSDGWGC